MQDWLVPYLPSVIALGGAGLLLILQLLILDLAGLRSGHRPGWPVAADTNSFHFRAYRAHANTNESLAAFIALCLAGMLSAAPPFWLNLLSGIYLTARLLHMLCYYASWSRSRSVAFGLGLLALYGMFAVTLAGWLSG